MKTIELIYKRLPDRISHFQQNLLYEDSEVIVTSQQVKPSNPIVIDGVTVLGDDFTAIWFVFANQWYDIGKIYNLNNQLTGYYCDIIMPMKRTETHFEITDLFLDLWVSPDGSYQLHDEDEFEAAIQHNWIQSVLAEKARNMLQNLISEIESSVFPPEIVSHWGLPHLNGN
jgi:predicted RNA-binding protein associated with RNAse of E/G family